jgi:hypothetical protein
MDRGIDRRLEKLDDQLTRRAGFLTRVLALSDAQARQVEETLRGSVSERESVLRGTRAGSIEPRVALLMGIELEQRLLGQIESVLTADQIQRLEAAKELLPLGGRGHRHGRLGGQRG